MKEYPSVTSESRTLQILLVLVSIALGWILLPFYETIMWGAIIALMFKPLHRRLLVALSHRRNLTAVLTLLIVVTVVIVPFVMLTAALAREVAAIYAQLQSGELNPGVYFRGIFNKLPGWISVVLARFGLGNFDVLQYRLGTALTQGSQFIATKALSIGQNAFEFVASLFVTLYIAFFLIRDGDVMAHVIRRMIPLAPAHKLELFEKFATVIRATVKGNLLVAAVQGGLGGLAFWFLGISGALLWAVLMAFCSLVPAVGAGLIWVPVAIYFFLTGVVWKGVALTAFGLLVIGLIDNLLRPLLVGKDTRMPDYLVMLTTLGGMVVFGINGFVLGPVIAAMFLAVWHIYGSTRIDLAPPTEIAPNQTNEELVPLPDKPVVM